jgi:hypothetical protein
VILAFWLAIELKMLEAAILICDLDPIVCEVVKNIRVNGQEILEKSKKLDAEAKKQEKINEFKRQYGEMGLSGKTPNPDD